jgi:aconitase A
MPVKRFTGIFSIMANDYERIFKENIKELILPLAEKVLELSTLCCNNPPKGFITLSRVHLLTF